ncbi:uncharacterized protein TrAFT101_009244 [Trichoderma asperellum]|nr:hypothetical protein TrAFT101_009244 [Trichoderma asperellum]
MATTMALTKNDDSQAEEDARQTATSLLSSASSYAHRALDSIIPSSSRQSAYDRTSSFASSQPILFSFIAFQILFSLLPILLFLSFALSTFFLTLGAAVIFTLFWVGVASLFLIPTLFITSSLAVLCWGSSLGSFIVARWLYHHAPASVFSGSSDTSSTGTEVTSDGAWKDVQVKQFDDVKSLE